MVKPKILYLSDSNLTKPGGAQQSMLVLREGLKSEFDISIIAPYGDKLFNGHIVLEKYNNFRLRGNNNKYLLLLIKDVLAEIRQLKPDIIHIQMPSSLIIINLLLKLKLINKNIKIIYTDRGVYGKYGTMTQKSINSIIKNADKIITTTEINRLNYTRLYKDYDKNKNKFKVIYNTGGKRFDNYVEGKKNEIRMKLGLDKNTPVIGFCGRYSEQKNWPLAKEIMEESNKVFNKMNFVIILGTDGSTEENVKANQYLKEIANMIGIDRVKGFINLNNDEASEYYYAFDYFILSSKWESFGRTAVEAMSRKNIVLGTNVDGLAEVIENDMYLFNSSKEAVRILEKISSNEKLLNKSKEYFFSRYHSVFGYKKNIESYKDLYTDILK